jgi:hypothetical protein
MATTAARPKKRARRDAPIEIRLWALAVPPSHAREIGAGRELRCDPALVSLWIYDEPVKSRAASPADLVVDLWSSTSLMHLRRSVSTIRVSIRTCCASAGSWCWRWSRRGAGMRATSSRTGASWPQIGSARFEQHSIAVGLRPTADRKPQKISFDGTTGCFPSPIKHAPGQRSRTDTIPGFVRSCTPRTGASGAERS